MNRKMTRMVLAACVAASMVMQAGPVLAAESSMETAVTEAETEAEGFNREEAESEIAQSVDLDMMDQIRSEDGLKAEDWLPIGSVVLLNGANKTLMVMARFVYNTNEGKYYEYCGCLYPEGFGDSEYYFFNHDDIDLVAQKGYEDDYEKLYRSRVLGGLNIALLNSSDETEAETETEGN